MHAGVKRYDNKFVCTEPLLLDTSFLLTVHMMPKIRVKSVSIIKTKTSIVKEMRQDYMIDFTIIYTITWGQIPVLHVCMHLKMCNCS